MPVNDVALVRRRRERLAALSAQVAAALDRIWTNLDGYTSDQQARWEKLASPVVTAAQSRSIDTQIAYLTAILGSFTFERQPLLARAAVDLSIPFLTLAKSIDAGNSFEVAVEAGRVRAAGLGELGVTWAARAANTAVSGDERIIGWTRTLSPGACDWCQTVAGPVYKTAESASFGHARAPCHCGVDPIIGNRDPGRTVNEDQLA